MKNDKKETRKIRKGTNGKKRKNRKGKEEKRKKEKLKKEETHVTAKFRQYRRDGLTCALLAVPAFYCLSALLLPQMGPEPSQDPLH